jgi:hypothetical protein
MKIQLVPMQIWQHKESKKHVLILDATLLLYGSEKEVLMFQDLNIAEDGKVSIGQKWIRDTQSFIKAHMPIGMLKTGTMPIQEDEKDANGHADEGSTGISTTDEAGEHTSSPAGVSEHHPCGCDSVCGEGNCQCDSQNKTV